MNVEKEIFDPHGVCCRIIWFYVYGFEPFWEFMFHYFVSEAKGGVQRLYIGPSRDVARIEFVCGFRPGRGYACHVQLDSRRRASGHAPVIRRSIWSDLLTFPSRAAGHMYIPELLCPYLYDEVV